MAAVALTAGASVTLPDHHDRNVSAAREPHRLPKLRPWRDMHAVLFLVGGSMSQDGQRMTPGPVRVHLQYIEPARKCHGHGRPHLLFDQSHWRLTGFRVLHGIGIWQLLSGSSQGKEPDQDPSERGNHAHSPQYSRFSDPRSRCIDYLEWVPPAVGFRLPFSRAKVSPRQVTVFPAKLQIQVQRAKRSRRGRNQRSRRTWRSLRMPTPTDNATVTRARQARLSRATLSMAKPDAMTLKMAHGSPKVKIRPR